MQIILNIPDELDNLVKAATISNEAIPTSLDEATGIRTPLFSEEEWVQEKLKRSVGKWVRDYENAQYIATHQAFRTDVFI